MSSETYAFPIVILGGGFAGTYCARALKSVFQEDTHKNVALLADQNAMLFHPMLAEVSGSSISPLHVVTSLRQFCRGSSFFMGGVEDVDLEQKTGKFSTESVCCTSDVDVRAPGIGDRKRCRCQPGAGNA